MDKEYFLSAGIQPPLNYEPSPVSNWQSLSSGQEMNCPSEQNSECFFNPDWDKSTDHQYGNFESALSSMVSSPAASSSAMSNDNFVIRELIGKLGNICNSPQSHSLMAATAAYIGGGNNSSNTSCYTTPLNSPPKSNLPIMDHFLTEKFSNLGNSTSVNHNLPALSADPGFAERAAKFSCFGSSSFNGRTSQSGLSNNELLSNRSTPLMRSLKLSRVSSSPSLKAAAGSPMATDENNNSAQTQMEVRSTNGSETKSRKRTEVAGSNEGSSVSEQIPNGETGLKTPNDTTSRKRKSGSRGKSKGSEVEDDSNAKRSKSAEGSGSENGSVKIQKDESEKDGNKGNTEPPEPPKDYIHVRARRGQATDSHSLAERVRREKISERMKLLQDLVPGCNKVTGKALMLDEIINYVQSLQRQVEFLSMKLSSVNPSLDFDMDGLLSKDVFQPNGSLPMAFFGHHIHKTPQPHTNLSNGAVSHCSVDPMDTTLCTSIGLQLPPVEEFCQDVPQFPTLCEDDLQSIVRMGLGRDSGFHPQSFHGSNPTSDMKIEL